MKNHKEENCIFCDIVEGLAPSYIIWQNETHIAFLTIYPNTPGAAVVIPKVHLPSYIFSLENNHIIDLMLASKEVALLLDKKLGTRRTALIFEGMGVNHIHSKLFPMHGLDEQWEELGCPEEIKNKYFINYEGYISSHNGVLAEKEELKRMRDKIIN